MPGDGSRHLVTERDRRSQHLKRSSAGRISLLRTPNEIAATVAVVAVVVVVVVVAVLVVVVVVVAAAAVTRSKALKQAILALL